MNEQATKSQGRRNILRRIRLSLLLGVSLIVVLGLLGNFLQFHIAKYLFWPALLFVKVYGDDAVGATYYYLIAIPLAIPVYSLIIYVYLTLRGWPNRQKNGVEAKEH